MTKIIKGAYGPAHSDAYDEVAIDRLIHATADILKD